LEFPTSVVAPEEKKSFSQTFSNTCNLPLCQLPPRTVKRDSVNVKISQHEYELGVEDGHRILHTRLTLQKGDSPLTTHDLYKKMSSLWPILKNLNIVPLCKGFFALQFNTV